MLLSMALLRTISKSIDQVGEETLTLGEPTLILLWMLSLNIGSGWPNQFLKAGGIFVDNILTVFTEALCMERTYPVLLRPKICKIMFRLQIGNTQDNLEFFLFVVCKFYYLLLENSSL